MELWIRSQDKEELVKVDNIRVTHEYEQKKVNDNYGITCAYVKGNYRCSYIYADSTWLGEYKNKERALEVLDEIQNILKPQMMIKSFEQVITQEVNDLKYVVNPQYEEIKELSTYVYEMPLD